MTTLDKIFDVWYGVNLEVVNSEVVERGIPFVSRQAVDNGVVCHVRKIEGITPNPAHTLSIAVSGSVLSTFYHDCEYYSGRDVYIAKPKEPMTREEMLYYAVIIEANKYKYNYGRGANKTFRNIIVPEKHELPKYINTYKAEPSFSEASIINKKYEINTQKWKWFLPSDIFTEISIAPSSDLNSLELDPFGVNYLSRAIVNNGYECKVKRDESKVTRGNFISVVMVGVPSFAFYQKNDVICSQNILVLRYPAINQYNALFLCAILQKDGYRYSYGRTLSKANFLQTKIKLPVTPSDEPDWKFMEDYIKSLPYSVYLEINEKDKLLSEIETYKHKVAALETQLAAQHRNDIHYHIDHVDTINYNDNSQTLKIE